MLNAGFQYLEQRDANDKITKDGVVGKNSPFATSDNSGIYDIIAEDLRWLKENVDDVKDTSDLEAIKQSVTDMYNEMKNDSSFGEAAAKAQAEEAKKQAQAALESATNAKTYRDDVVTKSTEANDTLAEIKTYIDKAEKLVESNKALEQSFSDYVTVATNKAKVASDSATNAKASETASKTSETNAKTSETNAAKSASNAALSETHAKTSETNSKASEVNAKASESNASTSKSNAATSESNAKSYMDTAKEYMTKAQEALAAAQAIQSIVDTAKANAEKCLADVEAVKESLAKMITYQGSVDNYSDLPTSPQVGYSYNIKNADKEHGVNAGDNVVWNGTDWDNFGGAIDMSLFAELGKDVKFNTVTATTFTGNLDGIATKATADGKGSNIADTYVKKSGSTMISNLAFWDGAGICSENGKYAVSLANSGMSMDVVGGDGHIGFRGLSSETYIDTATGSYHGNVVGNADTATNATADKYGTDIADNYVKKYVCIGENDLNNFRYGGLYAAPLDTNATAERHYPEVSHAGSILVMNNGANGVDGCTQIYTVYDTHNSYKREYNVASKTWSAWRKYAFEDSTVACATKLATPRTISLTGNASGSGTFDGSGNVSINTTVSQAANAERIRGESFWSNDNNYLLIGTLTIGQNGGAFGIKIQSGNFFNDGIESFSREASLYFRASNGSAAKYSAYAEYHRYGSSGMNFFINETSDNTYDIYLGPLMWSGNSICIPILSTACSFDKKYTNVSALPTGAKQVNSYQLVYTDTVNNYAPTKTGSGASVEPLPYI